MAMLNNQMVVAKAKLFQTTHGGLFRCYVVATRKQEVPASRICWWKPHVATSGYPTFSPKQYGYSMGQNPWDPDGALSHSWLIHGCWFPSVTWPIPIQTSALLCRVVAVGIDHFRFEQLCQGGKWQLRASDEVGIQSTKRALNLTWTNNVTGGIPSRIMVYILYIIYIFI